MGERSLRDEVVGQSLRQLCERVRRQRRHDEQLGACEVRVEILAGRPSRQREEGLRAHEPLRVAGD
jgi:hypothetical protein